MVVGRCKAAGWLAGTSSLSYLLREAPMSHIDLSYASPGRDKVVLRWEVPR